MLYMQVSIPAAKVKPFPVFSGKIVPASNTNCQITWPGTRRLHVSEIEKGWEINLPSLDSYPLIICINYHGTPPCREL
jgi:hypothetical protein